jgi:hypothetical protein
MTKILLNGKEAEVTPEMQAKYDARFADMLASHRAPASRTTEDFTRGKGTLADQFKGNEGQLNYIVKQAQRKGYTPNIHDIYDGSLAQYIGDPAGFIPSGSDALSHVRAVCEEKNLSCNGAFKRTRVKKDPKPEKPFLEKKLLKKYTRQMVAADPALGRKNPREIKEAVVDKYAYKGN